MTMISTGLRGACAGALIAALTFAPTAAQESQTVRMSAFSFAPTELHVAAGSTVSWVNASSDVHTATADDGTWDSGDMSTDQSFSMTFDEPGRYQFYCIYHGGPGLQDMAGVIVVDG